MNKDLSELLNLLLFHQVRFLVIGAHAVSFHARPRMTQDFDIWISRDAVNTEHLRDALVKFGAPIGDAGAKRLSEQDRQMVRIGVPPNMVDILNFAAGGNFDEMYDRRIHAVIEDIELDFPSRDDLIKLKEAAGRKQDWADVEALKKFR